MNEGPEIPIIRLELQHNLCLELQHSIASLERAIGLSCDDGLDADLTRLLEAARATLDLIKEDA